MGIFSKLPIEFSAIERMIKNMERRSIPYLFSHECSKPVHFHHPVSVQSLNNNGGAMCPVHYYAFFIKYITNLTVSTIGIIAKASAIETSKFAPESGSV